MPLEYIQIFTPPRNIRIKTSFITRIYSFTCSTRIMDTPLPILAIGHRFNTMQELRIACKYVAVSKNFELSPKIRHQPLQNSLHQLRRCPWLLHVSLITFDGDNSKIVEIETFITKHTCKAATAYVVRAGAVLISSAIEGTLRNPPTALFMSNAMPAENKVSI